MVTKRIKPSEQVLEVLRLAETETIGEEVVLRLVGQLDRKLYETTNKVLEELGGKWNRKAKGHIFPVGRNPLELLGLLVSDGEIALEKLDFFPTPPEIVKKMIDLALIPYDAVVLEPSAGTGSICDELVLSGVTTPDRIHFCEIDESRVSILNHKGYKFRGYDFLEYNYQYDYILMNPPFANHRDIDHVLHAFDCLSSEGVLVAIMAESAFFHEDKKSVGFRELLQEHGFSKPLPDDSFKESGTRVKTRIVLMRKSL